VVSVELEAPVELALAVRLEALVEPLEPVAAMELAAAMELWLAVAVLPEAELEAATLAMAPVDVDAALVEALLDPHATRAHAAQARANTRDMVRPPDFRNVGGRPGVQDNSFIERAEGAGLRPPASRIPPWRRESAGGFGARSATEIGDAP